MSKTETIYPALVLPWDEPASQFHPDHPRQQYGRGEVYMPRGGELPLRDGHGGPVIGMVTAFTSTKAGIEAKVRLGTRGEELLTQGHAGLSAEIDEDTHYLIGVALAVDEEPAFRSARIIIGDTPAESLGGYGHMEPVTVGGGPGPGPNRPTHSVTNLGEAREFIAGYGMAPVAAEVSRLRRWWRDRVEELHGADIADEEQRLVAAGVPKAQWPSHTSGRQSWEAATVVQRAEAIRDEGKIAERSFQRRMERLEADAERGRLPWYRRVVR